VYAEAGCQDCHSVMYWQRAGEGGVGSQLSRLSCSNVLAQDG